MSISPDPGFAETLRAAVGHLEDVLELSHGALSGLLGPALRGSRREDGTISAFWPVPSVIDDVVGGASSFQFRIAASRSTVPSLSLS